MLIDEADSILLDEASTPLVIGGPARLRRAAEETCYRWSAEAIAELREGVDYFVSERPRIWQLTADGRRRCAGDDEAARSGRPGPLATLRVPRAGLARRARLSARAASTSFATVRKAGSRRSRSSTSSPAGPAKDAVGKTAFTKRSKRRKGSRFSFIRGQAARVTVQAFFRRYPILSGMTGTASAARAEFRKMYQAGVVPIPTHRPSRRELMPTRVLGTAAAKWQAVVEEICTMQRAGRPVLVGTR